MKLSVNKKIIASVLAGTITLSPLTGCNMTYIDTSYTFNKAIIVDGKTATIVEIEKWKDYEGEQLQLITKDGMVINTSSFDTKLINDESSDVTADDIARSMVGDDGEIIHIESDASQKKLK